MQPQRKSRMRLLSDDTVDGSLIPEKSSNIKMWLHNVERHAKDWDTSESDLVDVPTAAQLASVSLALERYSSGMDTDTRSAGSSFSPNRNEWYRNRTTPTMSRARTYLKLDLPLPVRVYRKACKRLKTLPLRRVLGQFGRPRIILNDLCMSLSDVRAACKGLMHESSALYLDFSGNCLGVQGCNHVLQLLAENHIFKEVRLADNCLTGLGILAVGRHFQTFKIITVLDISGNRLTDRDGTVVAEIIKTNPQLRVLHVHHNEFRELAGKAIGRAIATTYGLEELDLSWNHIRQHGAIGLAKGLEKNGSLDYLNIGWNGFGFEGSVALSDALRRNTCLEKLDVSCNRIHPPALLELMKGLLENKVLKVLIMDKNPITPSFATVLLEGIHRSRGIALEDLSLQGIVVDRDFRAILEMIQQERHFHVEYETSLPVTCKNRKEMMKEIEMRNNYNVEPLRMLYLLKEKNRAQDFFHKINKDHDDGLTPDELSELFKECGMTVSRFVVDRIMNFMDTDRDGKIDLGEFLVGDKKMKKLSRDHARRKSIADEAQYSRYSRTFRQAHIQQLTSRLKVEETNRNYLSPIVSLTPSPTSSRRSSVNRMGHIGTEDD